MGAGTPCAWLARRVWQADLLVHFRLQYVVVSLAIGLVLASTGQFLLALLLLFVCGFNALSAWGTLTQSVKADFAESARSSNPMRVRLAAYNVLYRNRDPRDAVDWLRAAALDVVLLQEVTPHWCEALQVLADLFPHRYYSAAWVQRIEGAAGRGALLLSRWPIEGARAVALGRHTEPAIVATLQVKGQALSVIGAHTSWPMGPIVSAERDRQLRLLGELARTMSGPLVVAGDLNVTPFSPHYQTLLAVSGLRSAARGRIWQPTWPQFMPACGIQIDHILVSAAIGVERFERGPAMGSDHWPIIADLYVFNSCATTRA